MWLWKEGYMEDQKEGKNMKAINDVEKKERKQMNKK